LQTSLWLSLLFFVNGLKIVHQNTCVCHNKKWGDCWNKVGSSTINLMSFDDNKVVVENNFMHRQFVKCAENNKER
jgi:hypothetical protein